MSLSQPDYKYIVLPMCTPSLTLSIASSEGEQAVIMWHTALCPHDKKLIFTENMQQDSDISPNSYTSRL